jgi:putative ABC transport system permease protein
MLTRSSLALFNLAHNKARTLVAIGGVAFAVALLFMQLGFFAAVLRVAVTVYGSLDFDLVLTSSDYVTLTQSGSLPRQRLYQALGVSGVRTAEPFYVDRAIWTNPETYRRRPVVLLGVDPMDEVFNNAELNRQRRSLLERDTMLIDRRSRRELGPLRPGTVAELGSRRTTIVGDFTLGPGFDPGLAVVSDRNYSRVFDGRSLEDVSVGLLRLERGADPARVAEALRRRLPADVRVLTRRQIESQEQRYWVASTSTGIIFGSGVLVAAVFGVTIIYQVLSTEISTRIGEYATLKALGYSEGYIARVVLQQAAVLGVLGYAPATLMALVIYAVTEAATNLPVSMTAGRAVAVFVTTIALCCVSGLLCVRIVRSANPADLF